MLSVLRRCERPAWVLLFLLFAAFAVSLAPAALGPLLRGTYAHTDFFAQWSFARYGRQAVGAALYDADALYRFQLDLQPGLRQTFPFPYPPSFLLYLWPLGGMGYAAAYAAWVVATLTLWMWASLRAEWRWRDAVWLLLAPVTVITAVFGQTGFLLGALLVGGVRLLGPRPVLAGVLFGLVSFKPQFGVLLPVALLADRQWRCLAAAGLTVAMLVLASGMIWGFPAWIAWLHDLPIHAAYVDHAVSAYRKQSVLANLLLLHVPGPAAQALQGLAALAAIALVWRHFPRRSAGQRLALLASATFLAAPYAFLYDMPMLTTAALVMQVARGQRRWSPLDGPVLALLLAFPAIVTETTRFFWLCSLALVLFAGLVAWRTRDDVSA